MVTPEILQAISAGKWHDDGNGLWGNRPAQGDWWSVDAHNGWSLITLNKGSLRIDIEIFDAAKLPTVARAMERALEALWSEVKDA